MEIKDKPIVVLEENSRIGGLASLISSFYADKNLLVNLKAVGVKDEFIEHGSLSNQFEKNGLTKEYVSIELKKMIGEGNE